MVQRQSLAAAGTEADVGPQAVEQNLVDFLGHPLPAVVEPVLVHRTAEGLGEGEIQVQLSVIQLQLREGGRVLRLAGLLYGLSLLPAAQQGKEELPQCVVGLVKGDVGRPELLLFGEGEAQLPELGNDGDIPGDIQPPVGLHRGQSVPLGQHLQQVELHLKDQIGEPRHRVFQRGNDRLQPGPNQLQVLGGPHVALMVDAVPPGPARNLADFLGPELPALHPVEFLRLHEDDSPYGEIEAHADGVGGDDIFHPPLKKPLHLLPAGGVGEGPVDDGGLLPILTQVLGHTEHPHLGEGNQRVPRLDPLIVHGALHAHQGGLSPVDLHLVTVPAALNEADEQLFGLRGGAEVDFRGQYPQNGPGPGVPPLGVGNELALVNDGHIPMALQVQLFRCGGGVGVPLPDVLFLPGGQGALHPRVDQSLLGLQGQQAQGGQINPRLRPYEPLKARVGLSGVGAPQVEDKAAVHGPGLRVLVLGVQGNQQRQAGADGLGHVPHGPDRTQALLHQLGRGKALRPQKALQIRLRLGGGKVGRRLPGGLEQHLRVMGEHVLSQGVSGVLPQPPAAPEKSPKHLRQALAVTAALQAQKLPQPGRRLGRAQAVGLGLGGNGRQKPPVPVLRQPPGGGVLPHRRRPGPLQQHTGPPHPLGGSLRPLCILCGPVGKPGVLLPPAHLVPVPDPDLSAAVADDAGLGQQLPNQVVVPSALFQLGRGPGLSPSAARHDAPPFLMDSMPQKSGAEFILPAF